MFCGFSAKKTKNIPSHEAVDKNGVVPIAKCLTKSDRCDIMFVYTKSHHSPVRKAVPIQYPSIFSPRKDPYEKHKKKVLRVCTVCPGFISGMCYPGFS